MAEIFSPIDMDTPTRNSTFKLVQPYRRTRLGQNGLSYIGPSVWNSLDYECKNISDLNTFKHTLKSNFFLCNQEERE